MPAPPADDGEGHATRVPLGPEGAHEMWYSVDHGPVHFVQLNTEVPFDEGTPQWW